MIDEIHYDWSINTTSLSNNARQQQQQH